MIKTIIGAVGLVLISAVVFNTSSVKSFLGESRAVVETIEAGKTVSISFDRTFWGDTTTLTTEKGVFNVNGLVSMMTGESLVIKKPQSGKSFLCAEKSDLCYSLN